MLVTMASPAHFPMLEAPEAVHRVLMEFYRRSGTW
jgi:pimeloyl-ACP methyl ester carboxylesterase